MNNVSLNLDRLNKELILILELLKNDDIQYFEKIVRQNVNNVDWDIFLDLVMHHRVYPILISKLNKLDADLIPQYVFKKMNATFKKNTFKMMYFYSEMEQFSKIFLDNNIDLIFLKGPILGEELYGDLSLRACSDLDFLIPIKDLENAEQLLNSLGYVKDDYIKSILNDWKWRHHHVAYYHPLKNIKVEIHWRLHPGPAKVPGFKDLWERKRISRLTNYPVYYLGREDLFLFLVTHGARHGWSRLRWLIDIHQMINKELDWIELNNLVKKQSNRFVVGQSIILATKLLKTKIVKEMNPFINSKHSKRLAQDALFYLEQMVNLHTEPVPERISIYHKRHLFSLMTIHQKIIFILSFLYPYSADAETLPLPKRLHFLYFPLRPFLWFWRKVMGHAIS